MPKTKSYMFFRSHLDSDIHNSDIRKNLHLTSAKSWFTRIEFKSMKSKVAKDT